MSSASSLSPTSDLFYPPSVNKSFALHSQATQYDWLDFLFLHVLANKLITSGILAAGVTVREDPIAMQRSAFSAWLNPAISVSVESKTLPISSLITSDPLFTFRKTFAKVYYGIYKSSSAIKVVTMSSYRTACEWGVLKHVFVREPV